MRRTGYLGLALAGGCLLALLAAAGLADDKQGGFVPLFDGKTLEGWHEIGVGQWAVEDGVIVGRKEAQEKQFGHLVTDRTFKDFAVRLKFKAIQGNSGLYFRIEEKGFSGVSGFQAEIDASRDVGGLYETGGRAWVVKPTPEEVARYFKAQEWNEMSVSARGGHIVVYVNGVKTAELKDDPGRREGHIALQLHGGQGMHVMFKDIEIREE